jgi:hypothetical protein
MKITINGRLSFPNLFTAKSINDSEPKFGAAFLIDKEKGKATLDALNTTIRAVAAEKWPKGMPKGVKVCLHEGSEKEYDGYDESVMFISASSKKRPVVVNRLRQPVAEGDAQCPYAGCYVNAVVNLWAQDNQFGKRINASLEAVQFVKDGSAFGEAPVDPMTTFADVPEDDASDILG